MEIRDVITRFGADTSGFTHGATQVKASLTALNKDFYANKSAMKDVNTELKLLEKEQKKLDSLVANGQIDKQSKEYQENARKIDALNVKKAQLKTNEQELKQKMSLTTAELKQQTIAAQQNKISMEDVGNGLKKLATGYLAVTTAMFAFAAKMGANADDLNTLSAQTGLTTEELQKFQYASDIIDVSMDTLAGSMAKMIKNMAIAREGTGDAADAFKALGVEIESNGELIDKDIVFENTINALAQVGNETERDALAMQIFGKSAQDLNPLILGGADALKQLGDEAERAGLILSQEQLDKLNALNDKIDGFKAKLSQLSMVAGTEVVEAFDGLWDSADEIVDVIKDLAIATSKVIGFTIDHKEAILALVVAYGTFKASMTIGTLIASVASAVKTLTIANEAATISQLAMNTAVKANPYVMLASVILSLAGAIGTLAIANKKAKNEVDEYTQSMERAKETAQDMVNESEVEISTLEMKAEKYEELRKTQNRTEEQEKALKSLANDLQGYMPNTISLIDAETGAYSSLAGQIDLVVSKMRAKALLESKIGRASCRERV